jgi:nucleobase transporter 1/2
MAEVKPEDMVHHQPMDQLQGFEYCIDSNPSWGMYVMSHTHTHTHTQLVVERCCVHLYSIARGSLLILHLCVRVTGEGIALGFQHYILSLGTAVMIPTLLVPLMGGNDVRIPSLPLLVWFLDFVASCSSFEILSFSSVRIKGTNATFAAPTL